MFLFVNIENGFHMYKPSEDTYFMEDILSNYQGNFALEIGIGSGYLTRLLCSNYRFVVGTDIDINSIAYAKNINLSNISNKLLICSDLSMPLNCKFDLIVSNPPYLPTEINAFDDNTVFGGVTGTETTLRFLESTPLLLNESGRVVVMRSTLADYKRIDDFVDRTFLNKKIVAKKRLFFETLEILEISGIITKSCD